MKSIDEKWMKRIYFFMKRFYKWKGFLLFFTLEKEMKWKENYFYQPKNLDQIDKRRVWNKSVGAGKLPEN